MRVLVCGGRDFDNMKAVSRAMREVQERHGDISCVIEGGARGADYLGKLWAEREGIPVFECRANWNRFGKRAGHIRNGWMIEHGKPDLVVAFPGGRGTENMIAQAATAELVIVTPAQGTEAQRATTENTGVVHDGPVAEGHAPKGKS
jgi:hypothetical protein